MTHHHKAEKPPSFFTRKQKRIIHGILLALIAAGLAAEWHPVVDWAFFCLAVVCEAA
jgi:hypothetical protein